MRCGLSKKKWPKWWLKVAFFQKVYWNFSDLQISEKKYSRKLFWNLNFKLKDSFLDFFFFEIWRSEKQNRTFWKKATFSNPALWPITKRKYNNNKKIFSLSGNWTPVSRVTGGDTYHYTNKDRQRKWEKVEYNYLIQITPDLSPFPIPLSAWRKINSFSCVASTYT